MIFPVELTASEFALLQQRKLVVLDRYRPVPIGSLVICYVEDEHDEDMIAYARVQDCAHLTLRLA